jgi:hypothetical protein
VLPNHDQKNCQWTAVLEDMDKAKDNDKIESPLAKVRNFKQQGIRKPSNPTSRSLGI